MDKQRIKFNRLSFVFNGFVFFLGADLFFNASKLPFGIIALAIALLNFYFALKFNPKKERTINMRVNFINFLAAFAIMTDYFQTAKKYIPYAWLIITIMYFLVSLRNYLKYRQEKTSQS